METVMILGAGYMGSGIAQVCANGGYRVLLWDITRDLAERGKKTIADGLDVRVAKGKETPQHKEELLERIEATEELSRSGEADWVIEAVVENIDIKRDVLHRVERYCAETACIATNTSYLSVNELSSVLEKPERFLGLHFFGPVPAMRLVELICGEDTCTATLERAKKFTATIGKSPVVVKKDSPGFIVNRMNAALRMEAYRCYEEGIASIEDIDTAMKLGLNHPMGPFELNDLSGLDIGLAGLDTLYQKTGEERWRAMDKVRELVGRQEMGRKSGKGWYDYSAGEKRSREDL